MEPRRAAAAPGGPSRSTSPPQRTGQPSRRPPGQRRRSTGSRRTTRTGARPPASGWRGSRCAGTSARRSLLTSATTRPSPASPPTLGSSPAVGLPRHGGCRPREPRTILVLPAGPRHWEQLVRHDTSTVTWWGHATVEIRLDGARLVTDPLLRNRVGPLHSLGHRPSRRDVDALKSVDGVLLSHLHHDHTDLPSI